MKKSLLLISIGLIAMGLSAQVTDKIPGVNCDNVVDDKLKGTGATNRSASPCEVEFDKKVRTDLQNAFGKLIRDWAVRDWILEDTLIRKLKERARYSEKQFYFLEYELKLSMKPTTPIYQAWQKKFTDVMEELRSNPGEATTKKFMETAYKVKGITQIYIRVLVNNPTSQIGFFKGGQQSLKLEGAAYAVKGPYMVQETGGQVEDSKDGCLLLFGTPRPTVQRESNGAEYISSHNVFPKASHLTVQQISVRMECSEEWLGEVLKQIDGKALAKMIGSW